ncbi:phage antirepressor Ant [Sporosarcina sp. P37]|uniref:phage antirepressor n=1 Tax=unclassified Sporosarcina TaxID=2647733 RepID=UPI000A17E5D2|nr:MULTISPECIES: phage antirepressor [unclassified Sporosarcina]ARK23271.1 phage antirepressor Ant [Sporosarcina sp. P37]PID19521.1 phage antirepressor Ant [Sporosarcina sp. P35]
MNQITKLFEGQELRIAGEESNPLFLLKDVCSILGLEQVAGVKRRLDDDVISNHPIQDSIGRTQQATFINEDGLYDVVLESRKPEAKKFRKWITSEVIPSIRKHGGYLTPETVEQVLSDPDTLIRLATDLKEERLKRQQAELRIQQQQPKVRFAEAVETSETSILIGQLAKLITQNGFRVGQNRLFKWLRENEFLGKSGSHYNEPTQYAMERGWFEVKERTINNPDGSVRITRTTKVTGKGQVYFINKFLSLKDVI